MALLLTHHSTSLFRVWGAEKLVLGSEPTDGWTLAEVRSVITALIKTMFFDHFAGQWIDWVRNLHIKCPFATNASQKAFLDGKDAVGRGND